MRVAKIVLIVVLVIGLAVGSYALIYLHNQLNQIKTELQPVELSTQDHVVIYLIKSTPTDFHLVPVHRQTKGPISPASALQALLNGPLAHEEFFESVPHNTRLLGLDVQGGLATANFSQEIVKDFNGGSLIESYLVEAIVNTLTEFPDIDKVQILVEGGSVESIGGHVLISQPLRRTR